MGILDMNRAARAAGYGSGMKPRMTDEQRTRLEGLAAQAITDQQTADASLSARDAYVIELSDAGIGVTEIRRCIPGDEDGHMSRNHIYRILNDYRKRTGG